MEDLELDVAAAHDSLERLTTGLAAVRQAAAALEAAQRARTEAAHGVARVETLALAMDGLAQATTTRFERAELAQRKAEHQYEEGQRLATQVSRALRDRLAGFGDAQRERDRG